MKRSGSRGWAWIGCSVVLGCACTLGMGVASASAASGAAVSVDPMQPANPFTAVGPLGGVESYNWSGYAATGSTFTEVTSTYVQPKVSCPVSDAWTVFWVGLDGYNSSTVEQSGTQVRCVSGKPKYSAWWEMYPTNSIQTESIKIAPGNKITATDSYDASTGDYSLAVDDLTNGQSFDEVTACASHVTCERSSAEWIVERPSSDGNYTPLADWNTMKLGSDEAASSGGLAPVSSFTNSSLTMVNSDAQTLAAPGELKLSGTSFKDTWKQVS